MFIPDPGPEFFIPDPRSKVEMTLDRGSGLFIPDPGSEFSIPDPRSQVEKILDPGSGSPTKSFCNQKNLLSYWKYDPDFFYPGSRS